MPITRTFTVTELEALGVPRYTIDEREALGIPHDLDENIAEADERLWANRYIETRRNLFRHDGRVWAVRYQRPLTDDEVDTFKTDPVPAVAMEEHEVTVTRWQPVECDSPGADFHEVFPERGGDGKFVGTNGQPL